MADFLTIADVLAIHDDQIEQYGGTKGIRDPGQLEAALFRPQSGYYSDTIAQAAALWESQSQNHPFIDGNKRTAFASMLTFLIINDVELTVEADEVWSLLSQLYDSNSLSFSKLDTWLREHTLDMN